MNSNVPVILSEAAFKMSVKTLYLINLLDALGMALVLPLINTHVLALGGSLSLAGVLTSLSSGAQLFASPVIGSWSDTRGRKLLLVSTLATVFVSNALAGIPSLGFFFIARILYGAAHQTDPLLKALIADTVPKEDLTDIFNKLMAIGASAFILAPVLGGLLYELFQNFTYISIILCALDIATISVTFISVEEHTKVNEKTDKPKKEIQENQTNFLQSIYADLAKVFSDLNNVDWGRYGDLLAIKFFLEAAFSLLFMNLGVVLMEKFSFTQMQLGLSIGYISIVMIASNFLSLFLIKKFYANDRSGFQRILHGFVVLGVSFGVVPFAYTSVLYLSLLIPLSVAKALADSTWMEVLSSKTTEKDKGVMMGAAASMMSLSGLICPLIGGFTGDYVGVTAVTILPIFPTVFGSILVNKVKYSDTFTVEKND